MDVAIVVPSLDGLTQAAGETAEFLAGALRALDFSVRVEVVANGPAADGPNARRPPENLGFGRAINWWLATANVAPDVIIVMNDDLCVSEAHASFGPEFAVFVDECLRTDEPGAIVRGVDDVHRMPSALAVMLAIARLNGLRRRIGGGEVPTTSARYPSAYLLVLPLRAFRAVGGFDGRYPLYFEDADLADRFLRLGRPVRILQAPCLRHRRSGTYKSGSTRRRRALVAVHAFSAHQWLLARGRSPLISWLVVLLGLMGRVLTGGPGDRVGMASVALWWARSKGRAEPALPVA